METDPYGKAAETGKAAGCTEAFMGISEFTDIPRDYCILCVVLMYLEDTEGENSFFYQG